MPERDAQLTDRELLARVAKGDEMAFATFYERHARRLFGHVSTQLTDDRDVEEVVQDVLLRATTKWRSINYADGSARTWLLGAANNESAHRRRAASRRMPTASQTDQAPTIPDMIDVDERLELRLEVSQLEAAVAQMDGLDQRIYQASFDDGRSHVETAALLGVPVELVRKRAQRIRERLRHQLRGSQ